MKKLFIKFSLLALVLAGLTGCDEDRVVYSGEGFVQFGQVKEDAVAIFENVGTFSIPIGIDKPRKTDTTITVTLTDDTAIQGTDYTVTSTSLVIPAGQTSVDLVINPIDNDVQNDTKTFTVEITAVSDPTVAIGIKEVGSYKKIIRIANDDCPTHYSKWFGNINVEDVGYGSTPGTASVTPSGACDILRVVNNLPGFPGFPGAGAPGYFDIVFTPDFDGATTGTVQVASTPLAPNGSYFATYEGEGVYDEDSATITIDYSVKAHSGSYTGAVAGTYFTGTTVITIAQ